MPRFLPGRYGCRLLVGLFLVSLWAPVSLAQDKSHLVKFKTADFVTLIGTWYPGTKDSPVILMLHPVGKDRKMPGWQNMAKELQAKKFAVLTLDFRGHGDSTDVEPGKYSPIKDQAQRGFWDEMENQKLVKGFNNTKRRETISWKDFAKNYWPLLVNDVAAAKAFLDEKNDSQECNSRNLILLGAQTGATIGALWLHEEEYRYRVNVKNPGTPFAVYEKDPPVPEARNVLAAIWLTMSSGPQVGAPSISISKLLSGPCKDQKVRVLFLYGEKDKTNADNAKAWGTAMGKVAPTKNKLNGAKAVKSSENEGTNLAGADLLSKSLNTEKLIMDYLELVLDEKKDGNPWQLCDFTKSDYRWYFPGRPSLEAKPSGRDRLLFMPLRLVVP
jgi:hypothetical protein